MSLSALDKTGLARFWSKVKAYVNHENVLNAIGYTPATTAVATKTANGLLPMLPNDDDANKFMRQDGTWQRVKIDNIPGGFLQIHPSAVNGFTVPYLNNDLAFLRAKGGDYRVYYVTDEMYDEQDISSINSDRVFDASYTLFNVQQPSMDEIVFYITTPQVYKWNSKIYIDFADASFACRRIVIEARQAGSDTWETFYTTTTNTAPYIVFSKSFYAGTGIDGLRITFSDWIAPTSQFALAQIGLINYASQGANGVYLPLGGGSMYGSILPYSYGTMDLGSFNRYWKNIYTKKVTLDADPVNPLEAATKRYVDNNKGPQVINYIATALAENWSDLSQHVSAPGISNDNWIIVSPDSDSEQEYKKCGVSVYGYGWSSINLICKRTPSTDITINIIEIAATIKDCRPTGLFSVEDGDYDTAWKFGSQIQRNTTYLFDNEYIYFEFRDPWDGNDIVVRDINYSNAISVNGNTNANVFSISDGIARFYIQRIQTTNDVTIEVNDNQKYSYQFTLSFTSGEYIHTTDTAPSS